MHAYVLINIVSTCVMISHWSARGTVDAKVSHRGSDSSSLYPPTPPTPPCTSSPISHRVKPWVKWGDSKSTVPLSLAATTTRSHWRAANTRWAERSKPGTAGTAWWTTATRTFSSTRTAPLSASTRGERRRGRPPRSKPPFRPRHEERNRHPSSPPGQRFH